MLRRTKEEKKRHVQIIGNEEIRNRRARWERTGNEEMKREMMKKRG